jgi:hypothetical protein
MGWRQRLIDSGAVSRNLFKEAHIRLVLRSGRTDVAQIRAMLPGSVAEHAQDMARLLAELENESAGESDRATERQSRRSDDAWLDTSADTIEENLERPFKAEDFAAFTFGQQRAEVHTIGMRRRQPDEVAPGALELTWPPYSQPGGGVDAVVIYRVVSAEDSPPYSPDRAHLITATSGSSAVDGRGPDAATRHYQVWVNTGSTLDQALANQPVKHADAVLVNPVRDFSIREDNGRVIGRWDVPPAVHEVFVYRIPAGEPGRERLQHRILTDSDNLRGFVDVGAVRGQRYVYRVRCAVTVEGVLRLSEASEATVTVSAVLAPVLDLSMGAHSIEGSVFELSWTPPPAGQVLIYRGQTGPNTGGAATELPEAALAQIGLDAEQLLSQPVSQRLDGDGRPLAVMSGVSWPDGWSRAYFTPVTLVAGRALVGRTLSSVRTGAIGDVDLAEYCNKQVLTFEWPTGAAAVVVHLAPTGHDPRNGLTGKSFEISLEEYEKYGGMQFSKRELPDTGCSLHLAPVAFSGGRRILGAIRSVEYAGLLRIEYALGIGRDSEGRPAYATIALRSQHHLPGSPAFVLINNPQRLPLSVHDGQPVDAAPVNGQGQIVGDVVKELRWSELTTHGADELWAANLHGLQGCIRLFVNTDSPGRLRTIALLDPPVEHLRLTTVTP